MRRLTSGIFAAVSAFLVAGILAMPALAQPHCRDFAYGNAGFGAGYSMAFSRGFGVASNCGTPFPCPPRPICPPRSYAPAPCGLSWAPCSRCCMPRCRCGGGYGTSWEYGVQSVYLASPRSGGAMFFSGGVVPWPVPYAVPVPYGVPWLGRVTPTAPPRQAVARSSSVAGVSSLSARTRGHRLVAEGDRHLAESGGRHDGLLKAAYAYRKASATVKDDPDIHIRHAMALAACGKRDEADAAIKRAEAIDGRLSRRLADGVDPAAPSAIVARGMAILREVGASAKGDEATVADTIAVLAELWTGHQAGPLAAIAAGDLPPR